MRETCRWLGAEPADTGIFFAPHPDDIAISAGAMALALNSRGLSNHLVMATSGSEAQIPPNVLQAWSWNPTWSPAATLALRTEIRYSEGLEEGRRLGFSENCIINLADQAWHTKHQTPCAYLHEDLSLRSVAGFVPGPIEYGAIDAMKKAMLMPKISAQFWIPHPNDRLIMHRIVSGIALAAARIIRLENPDFSFDIVFYEALSNTGFDLDGIAGLDLLDLPPEPIALAFDAELMELKCHAIRAHCSMNERRRLLGGYSTGGTESYETIVARRDRNLASQLGLEKPFAERCIRLIKPGASFLEKNCSNMLRGLTAEPALPFCS